MQNRDKSWWETILSIPRSAQCLFKVFLKQVTVNLVSVRRWQAGALADHPGRWWPRSTWSPMSSHQGQAMSTTWAIGTSGPLGSQSSVQQSVKLNKPFQSFLVLFYAAAKTRCCIQVQHFPTPKVQWKIGRNRSSFVYPSHFCFIFQSQCLCVPSLSNSETIQKRIGFYYLCLFFLYLISAPFCLTNCRHLFIL